MSSLGGGGVGSKSILGGVGGVGGVFGGGCIGFWGGIWGGASENLKIGPSGVGCHARAKEIPLVYLSPLLTVRKEFSIFVL